MKTKILYKRRANLLLMLTCLLLATTTVWGQGNVVAWGFNGAGQCNIPAGLTGVKAIAAGARHTVALKNDGTVVAWGSNSSGQCDIPAGLTGVTAIAANGHTVALKNDGTVVAWGLNSFGQCNVPVGLTGVTAIAAGLYHTVALKNDGTVVAWGDNWAGQCNIPVGLTGVTSIAAGYGHTVALKNDGTVVAWGRNNEGQRNVPSGLNGVMAVAAGMYHTVALKDDGTVVAWGDNGNGQCNVPVGLTGVKATSPGGTHTVALKNHGEVVAWGWNNWGICNVPTGLTGVTAIAAGEYHTAVIGNIVTCTTPSTPTISTSGETSFCTGGSVTLTSSATSGNLWSNGATTQSINVSNAASYTVRTISGACTSAVSAATVVEVLPVPSTPSISASGSIALSLGGSVTLTASAGADSYLWSNGAITQSITVSNAGSYSVRAISNGCTSAVSAATEVTVNNNLMFNACGASIVVPATRLGSTVFFMEWTPNPSVFSSYRIQWRRTDITVGWSATPTYDGTRSAFKIENLLPDTEYEFRFQVTCTSTGTLTNTNAVVVRTKNVLCSVQSLGVDTIGRNNVWVGWTPSAGIATYEVSVKAASATTWGNGVFVTNSPSAPVSGVKIRNLLAGTAYSYRVRATCNNEYQDLTRFVIGGFTTLSNVACATITPTSSAQTPTSISVEWNGGSSYKAYIVRWQAAGSSTWKMSPAIPSNMYMITGLSSGVTYNIQVQGQCATMGEWTDFGGVLNAQASSSSTCSTPAIDSLKASATRSVSVFWTPASNISQYEISRRVVGGTWNAPIVVAGTANRANLSSTWFASSFGNNFEVRMRARCADNNTFVAYQIQAITLAGAARAGIAEAINLSVYPNPSTGLVNISAENLNETAMYYVYNAMGQMVASGELTETASVDLSLQASGMYLLKVVANGAVQTKQVVISR